MERVHRIAKLPNQALQTDERRASIRRHRNAPFAPLAAERENRWAATLRQRS